jgi:hypothetical protein
MLQYSDVVCLQEVEPELWAMLERHVPGACSFVFAPHPNRPDGVAIISRLESIGPQSPITVLGYGAAFDEYFIEGEIVTVASMHLPFNDDPTWPSAILRDVLGFFSRSEFAVIGLDANAPWASPVFDALRQRDLLLEWTLEGQRPRRRPRRPSALNRGSVRRSATDSPVAVGPPSGDECGLVLKVSYFRTSTEIGIYMASC